MPDCRTAWLVLLVLLLSLPYFGLAQTSNRVISPSVLPPSLLCSPAHEQLTRIDVNYNVLWRYQLPVYSSGGNYLEFTQVRELTDGTLLALVRPFIHERTFWLYRFNAATGALLNVYPFTSAFGTIQLHPSHLLPVAADSSLVLLGGSRPTTTNQVGPIYVVRLRVSGLPRVVTLALPLAARARWERGAPPRGGVRPVE